MLIDNNLHLLCKFQGKLWGTVDIQYMHMFKMHNLKSFERYPSIYSWNHCHDQECFDHLQTFPHEKHILHIQFPTSPELFLSGHWRKHQNPILWLVWEPGSLTFRPLDGSFLGMAELPHMWAEYSPGIADSLLCSLVRTSLPCSPRRSFLGAPLPRSVSFCPSSLLVAVTGNRSLTSCVVRLSGMTTLGLPHVQRLQNQCLMYIFCFR